MRLVKYLCSINKKWKMIECYCSFCQSEIDPRSTICTGNTVFALLSEKRARSLFTLEFQKEKMLMQPVDIGSYSDYGSCIASVIVDQSSVEDILKNHARRATLERLRSNGVKGEDDLVDLTETQLEYMGIGVIERRKVLARTDSLR